MSSENIYDVIIIGSGPAGDTAAIYCQRAGFKVILVSGYEIKQLRSGVVIDGKRTSKATVKLKKYDKKTDKSTVELIIHEGRNHQIKKMFEVIKHDVVKLKRETYANLNLTGLLPGEYRKLTNKEVAILYSLIKK